VGNDVSGRDWQQDTPTMWPGESFDTHGPIGPRVVTADEVDPAGLGIRTWVDGELRQDGSTKEMVTGIGDMIAGLSAFARWSPATSSPPARPAASACSPDDFCSPVSGYESRSRQSAPSRIPSSRSSPAQCFPQVGHPRGGDRQRAGPNPLGQPEVQFRLLAGQPRSSRGLQRGQFDLVVRRADVFDRT
jgi:hypothetical protein